MFFTIRFRFVSQLEDSINNITVFVYIDMFLVVIGLAKFRFYNGAIRERLQVAKKIIDKANENNITKTENNKEF